MSDTNKISALPEKLYGDDLLARVKALQNKKKKPTIKEMARSCGYLHKDTGGEQITEFQRELLIASGVIEYPSSKPNEAPEPLRVGALHKIYNAKEFLAQLDLKDGDSIQWNIRKTKNGLVAELRPLPREVKQELPETDTINLEAENGDRPPLLPIAPENHKEAAVG